MHSCRYFNSVVIVPTLFYIPPLKISILFCVHITEEVLEIKDFNCFQYKLQLMLYSLQRYICSSWVPANSVTSKDNNNWQCVGEYKWYMKY
jgi:hypothetical protein